MKKTVIYRKGNVKVYVNQCRMKGRKTKVYTIYRDDKKASAQCLGVIVFRSSWRQYVFRSDESADWCSDCLDGVSAFLVKINDRWRTNLKKR